MNHFFSLISNVVCQFRYIICCSSCILYACLCYGQSLSNGSNNYLVLCDDDSLYVVGNNYGGVIGDTTISEIHYLSNYPKISEIRSISSGIQASYALKNDGTVWSWGDNLFGQLLLGSTSFSFDSPQKIDTLNNVSNIIAGDGYHVLFLKKDGSVWGGGSNGYGELGLSDSSFYPTPVKSSLLSGIESGTVGGWWSMVLDSSGNAHAFGDNASGQLGVGDLNPRPSPTLVAGISEPIKRVVGTSNSCYFLTLNGNLYATGSNSHGQLGNGTSIGFGNHESTPVKVPLDSIVDISSERRTVLALRSDGTVWGWGRNDKAQLGLGDVFDRNLPTKITPLKDIYAISNTQFSGLAIDSAGNYFTWGTGPSLGQGINAYSSNPTQISVPGCIQEINLSNTTLPSLNDPEIHIYPNPTSGSINITSDQRIISVKAYNQVGLQLTYMDELKPIDLKSFSSGLVMLEIEFENQIIWRLILKK